MLMIFFNKNVNSSISKFITARGEDICLAMLIHVKKKMKKVSIMKNYLKTNVNIML